MCCRDDTLGENENEFSNDIFVLSVQVDYHNMNLQSVKLKIDILVFGKELSI